MVRPWSDIQETYESFTRANPKLQSMASLVAQVGKSHLSRLHAWTSMNDLYIVQQAVSYPYDGPRLLVSPRFDGNIELRYIDTLVEKKQWRRLLREDLAFARLERIADELRWFPHIEVRDSEPHPPSDVRVRLWGEGKKGRKEA
jgi:hypothetical protein